MQYELIRNANVHVNKMFDENGHPIAQIDVDGKIQHQFDSSSRVSKALEIMTPDDLSERLTGGQYFAVDDELVDFRDGEYHGFIHTDESIKNLVEHIGIHRKQNNSIRVHENTTSNDIILGARWSDHDIVIPEYKDGGQFTSELHFGWSPFIKTVNSAFKLTRLICENGMRGLRTFMNTKIPLVNRWEEHLDIADRQIQHKVNEIVVHRLRHMGTERATVAEATLIAQHARYRRKTAANNEQYATRLDNIIQIVSPRKHLSSVYRDNVFSDHHIAAQHPAHLTTFDLYNIATELRSHTTPVEKSTTRALDKISNDLIFEHKDLTQHISRSTLPKQCMFSDPQTAFYGEVA